MSFLLFLMFSSVSLIGPVHSLSADCERTVTTASGILAPRHICSGQLIFEDNFNLLNLNRWQHEITLSGGGSWEFQWYTNNRSNSYTNNGILYLRPTLTADDLGEAFLSSGILNINGGSPADQCTNPLFWGCERTGTPTHILNPIKSARIRSIESFAFKYGKVEVRAKLPAGDWLWPAIWFLPKRNGYGKWPSSGEIDLLESRGNLNLTQNGVNIGSERMGSTLHFGPSTELNAWPTAHYEENTSVGDGFDKKFHRYQMLWTPEKIMFSIDDVEIGTVHVEDGFWVRGNFEKNAPGIDNPWRYGTKMAPFDQEFYCVINLAVGGTSYFPDDVENPGGKPWSNNSPHSATDFWDGRTQWLPTWQLDKNNSKEASLKVDYIRIWAL